MGYIVFALVLLCAASCWAVPSYPVSCPAEQCPSIPCGNACSASFCNSSFLLHVQDKIDDAFVVSARNILITRSGFGLYSWNLTDLTLLSSHSLRNDLIRTAIQPAGTFLIVTGGADARQRYYQFFTITASGLSPSPLKVIGNSFIDILNLWVFGNAAYILTHDSTSDVYQQPRTCLLSVRATSINWNSCLVNDAGDIGGVTTLLMPNPSVLVALGGAYVSIFALSVATGAKIDEISYAGPTGSTGSNLQNIAATNSGYILLYFKNNLFNGTDNAITSVRAPRNATDNFSGSSLEFDLDGIATETRFLSYRTSDLVLGRKNVHVVGGTVPVLQNTFFSYGLIVRAVVVDNNLVLFGGCSPLRILNLVTGKSRIIDAKVLNDAKVAGTGNGLVYLVNDNYFYVVNPVKLLA